MAELVGTVSAAVGLVIFVTQVAQRIDDLNATYKYNQNEAEILINSLTSHLNVLRQILQFLQSRAAHPAVEEAIVECHTIYSSIELALEELLEKVSFVAPGQRNGLKVVKQLFSRDRRKEVERIGSRIEKMNSILTLSLLLNSLQPPTTKVAGPPGESTATPASSQSSCSDSPVSQTPYSIFQDEEASVTRRAYQAQRASCSRQHCYCSCHLTERIKGRYWGFEYTPFSALFERCSDETCAVRSSSWRLRFALNKFRIPCAFVIGLILVSDTGKYTIQPALSVQRVVDYTSGGFEIIRKCQQGLIPLSEAKSNFHALKKSDGSLKNHVNPDGEDYVQNLLIYGPWMSQDTQFSLLEFLVSEFGMTLENQDAGFFIKCVAWIGEGRHLDLLDTILENGFDLSNTASPVLQRWPQPSSPDWRSEKGTPDPFFIEYLATLAKTSPGFAGITALHEAILLQSVKTVRRLANSSLKLEDDRNFLGQTPLHLASVNIEISRILLEAGHRMDVTDNYGITPLMYAAGIGNSQLVKWFILRGAGIDTSDTRLNRDFISYASAHGHWELIFESLYTIRSCFTLKSFQYFVIDAMMALIASVTWIDDLKRATYFKTLVDLCEDVNFTFEDGNTGASQNNLLHYVRHENEAQALVRHGFRGFNQQNSDGKLGTYSIAACPNAQLFKYCLDNGSNVNHVDSHGRSVLSYLIAQLRDSSWLVWDTIDSIKLCLSAGANIFLPDDCECPCVSDGDGCHTSSMFCLQFDTYPILGPPGFVWALEWLTIVEEFRGYEASKQMLISFVRRTQADIVNITHSCCHGGKGVMTNDYCFYKQAKPTKTKAMEILDEEDELFEIVPEDEILTNKSLLDLKSQWINLLKRQYDEAIKKQKESDDRRQPSKSLWEVDYKNDRFLNTVICPIPLKLAETRLTKQMAGYAFWMQHECFRDGTRLGNIEKEGWHERRMTWFRELMKVMQICEGDIVEKMLKMDITETRSEDVDKERIVAHFIGSVSSNT